MKITAEFSPNQKRIWVRFPYNRGLVEKMKRLPGASYIAKERVWSFPAELKAAQLLRENLGSRLKFSPELTDWGKRERKRLRAASSAVLAEDATLVRLPLTNPPFAEYLRPYQRADIAAMATRDLINANQPGLGKTVEVIGAILERGINDSRHMIIAPISSHELVWLEEITRWVPGAMVHMGLTPIARQGAVVDAAESAFAGPTFCVVNPEAFVAEIEAAAAVKWDTVTVDEFDRFGLSNPNTLFHRSLRRLTAARRWFLSGTPLGGKAINLWGTLSLLDPDRFTSRWTWAQQWLDVKSNGFGHDIGELKARRDHEFFAHHTAWMVRRLKSEYLTDLPPKVYSEAWVTMPKRQAKQYKAFEEDGEIILGGQRVLGTNTLSTRARLRQLAFGVWEGDGKGELLPTAESPKLAALLTRLQHHGVDRKGGEWAVIGSHSSKVCDLVEVWLGVHKISCAKITGATPARERTRLVKLFQSGKGPRVMVVNTKAAGASISLDIADSMHILTESDNPDNELQLEDRIHRGSRNHNCKIYYYRTRGTIDEEIRDLSDRKKAVSTKILDDRRKEGAFKL